MSAALDFLTRLGPARLAAMGAVTLALIGFFAFVIMRVSQPELGVLFTDLSPQDAGAIMRELDARGIRYQTRAEGQTILAPRAELARIRMDLAGKSLPSGGGVGYEIFDKGDAFSATSFVQNINHLRALEGELARTIRSLGQVQAARVHLAIPERRLFERDREPPRASIVLRLRGELDSGQIRAIRHLAASAVEGLRPERVSIVDERGRLLADGAGSEASLGGLAADDKQASLERRLRAQVESIVAGVVGPGRARVEVATELDLNRIESRSETFDPESRVVRSTQTRGENQVTASGEGTVSVGNELPGANPPATGAGRDSSSKNEEVVNYEISRTTRTEILEGGRIKRLSVAVLVDGVYGRGGNGEATYEPRPQEELDRIAALVRTAVGFDRNRGDQIEVVNLRFAEQPLPIEAKEEPFWRSLVSFSRDDIMRLAELAVLGVLTLIVVMAVVRPLVRTMLAGDAPARAAAAEHAALIAKPGGEAVSQRESAAAKLMTLAKINGELHAGSVEQLGDLVAQNPREAVAVLRDWIHDK